MTLLAKQLLTIKLLKFKLLRRPSKLIQLPLKLLQLMQQLNLQMLLLPNLQLL